MTTIFPDFSSPVKPPGPKAVPTPIKPANPAPKVAPQRKAQPVPASPSSIPKRAVNKAKYDGNNNVGVNTINSPRQNGTKTLLGGKPDHVRTSFDTLYSVGDEVSNWTTIQTRGVFGMPPSPHCLSPLPLFFVSERLFSHSTELD